MFGHNDAFVPGLGEVAELQLWEKVHPPSVGLWSRLQCQDCTSLLGEEKREYVWVPSVWLGNYSRSLSPAECFKYWLTDLFAMQCMNLKGSITFAAGSPPWDWCVSCVVWDVLWVRACWDSQIGESQIRIGLGLKWAAGSEQSWVWAAQLEWHHLDIHKFWVCKRLHSNSEDAFLSSAPKCCPDFVLNAFRTLSLIKNEAKVCVAMLPCGRQPTPALLLSVHVAVLGGWVTGRNCLSISASVPVRPLRAGGASQQAVCC